MIGIILFVVSTIFFMTVLQKKVPISTPRPILKNKEVELTMSHAMTNQITSELMRQKAELSRNNHTGSEMPSSRRVHWSPSVN